MEKLSLEKEFGGRPFSFDGSRRKIHHFGCFLNRQPAEKSQLENARLPFVEPSQIMEGFVQSEQIQFIVVKGVNCAVERDTDKMSLAFLPVAADGVVDENAAHHIRRDFNKLRAVDVSSFFLLTQPQVSFVNQRRRLQSMVGALLPHVKRREPFEFVIYERVHLV